MSKGIGIQREGVNFVLMVLLIVVGGLLVASQVIGRVEGLDDWFNELMGGFGKKDPFYEAVKCAYYRCHGGCDSTKIGKLLGGNCKKYFCDMVPDDFKDDGRICAWNSIQYPVVLEGSNIDPEKKYTKDYFDPQFTCVLPTDAADLGWKHSQFILGALHVGCAASLYGALPSAGATLIPAAFFCGVDVFVNMFMWATGQNDYNNLLIDASLIGSREAESCDKTGLGQQTQEALKEFTLNDRNIYIHSGSQVFLGDRRLTVASSLKSYKVIGPGEEYEIRFADPDGKETTKYRIQENVSEEDFIAWIFTGCIVEVLPGNVVQCTNDRWVSLTLKNLTAIGKDDVIESKAFFENRPSTHTQVLLDRFKFELIDMDVRAVGYGYADFKMTYYPEGIKIPGVPQCYRYGKDNCPYNCKKCECDSWGHAPRDWCVDISDDCKAGICSREFCGASCGTNADCPGNDYCDQELCICKIGHAE